MVDRENIQLSHNEAEAFLHNMHHPDPEAAAARNTFLRDARNSTKYVEENGETRIWSDHINEEGLRNALMRRRMRREAVSSSVEVARLGTGCSMPIFALVNNTVTSSSVQLTKVDENSGRIKSSMPVYSNDVSEDLAA